MPVNRRYPIKGFWPPASGIPTAAPDHPEYVLLKA
jgi:hypothetical protein